MLQQEAGLSATGRSNSNFDSTSTWVSGGADKEHVGLPTKKVPQEKFRALRIFRVSAKALSQLTIGCFWGVPGKNCNIMNASFQNSSVWAKTRTLLSNELENCRQPETTPLKPWTRNSRVPFILHLLFRLLLHGANMCSDLNCNLCATQHVSGLLLRNLN